MYSIERAGNSNLEYKASKTPSSEKNHCNTQSTSHHVDEESNKNCERQSLDLQKEKRQ